MWRAKVNFNIMYYRLVGLVVANATSEPEVLGKVLLGLPNNNFLVAVTESGLVAG